MSDIDWTWSTQVLRDAVYQSINDAILASAPDEKERRRYALLQAAAVIDASLVIGRNDGTMRLLQEDGGSEAVQRAEALLAEIEKREP